MNTPRALLSLGLLIAVAGGSSALAQSFNADVQGQSPYPEPSNAYGGAAVQPGKWNITIATIPPPPTPTLLDIGGNATNVHLYTNGGIDFGFPNSATTRDDQNLLDDGQDPWTGGCSWFIDNLADGNYAIYTYGWVADCSSCRTKVNIPGAVEGEQIVGGVWTGTHALGLSYALHHVTVSGGNTIQINVDKAVGNGGMVNGFQIVAEPAGTLFCFGDGSLATACPCANFGATGHGCANSVDANGALFGLSGTVSPDTVQFSTQGMPQGVGSIYLQGDTVLSAGAVFGDGVRCAGGNLVRLGLKIDTDADGATTFGPASGDPQVSVAGGVISGNTYAYQAYYRNPNPTFCPPATFNISNGATITW